MTLEEGISTLKGRPVEIPGVSRNDIPGFIKARGGTTGVEIGVYRGEYAEILAQSGLKMYGVDPWLAYVEYPYYGYVNEQWRENENYEETVKRIAPYPNYQLIRNTSIGALDYFQDESLDFVYIDGNHSFKYVAEDICNWIKKVKKGGFLFGHDYFWGNPENMHVRHVVDAYVNAHGIKNLWVLGRKNADKGEIRDKWRSWGFQKP